MNPFICALGFPVPFFFIRRIPLPPFTIADEDATPAGVWVKPTLQTGNNTDAVPAVFLPTTAAQYVGVLHGMMDCGLLPHASNTAEDPLEMQVESQTLQLLLSLYTAPHVQHVVADDGRPDSPGGRRPMLTLEELASGYQPPGSLPPLQPLYSTLYPLHADIQGDVLDRALRALEQLDYAGGGAGMHGMALHIVQALDNISDATLAAQLSDTPQSFPQASSP